MDDKKNTWRIENKVSLATFITVIAAVWTFSGRVTSLEARSFDNSRRIEIGEEFDRKSGKVSSDICERLSRVEERSTAILGSQNRMENSISEIHKIMISKNK